MSVDFTSVAASVGVGGVAGFVMGYAIKKILKIVMVIVGLFLAALAYLASQNVITINWDKIGAASTSTLVGLQNATIGATPGAADQVMMAMANIGIPLTGSFAAAFALGFMKG
ncbi:hypothetical protein NTE_00727 [Candidatus Nitrososphaera evergladensis SR1]|uniref:FUN14 family protein n=1 Tax=Candidatus Nitrososphaera evergladensis SR1 TaxID=1459636 RepID=A0A075MNU5_9ARCH|nr:FUN14 domain-containing protein [Candidatus Nitrososphaera evergladensis]AIF82805.1 hypothetical protein NTE_00727 [Candidatus Nitrososphaera evergladensis SR1]